MKRKLALMLVISLILSLGAFSTVSFAADNDEIIITTGAEFVEKVVSANFGRTFIIEGSEDADGDGVNGDGIVLPSTYQVTGFYGSLRGVDGKNNILIPGTNSIFSTIGAGNTEISNLVLRGNIVYPSSATHIGVLISNITDENAIVTIDGITNYVDVKDNLLRYFNMGGIVGNVSNTGITIRNCVNYGYISITREYMAVGGILGGSNNAKTITIENCTNHGDIIGAKSGSKSIANHYVGGIYGSALNGNSTTTPEEKIIITKCANYGDIKTSGAKSLFAAGIAARVYNGEISKCFNAGEIVSTAAYAAGICIQWDTGSSKVSDCFNVGVIKNANYSTVSYNTLRTAAGIVSCHEDNRNGATVATCYNAGDLSQRSEAKADSTTSTYAKHITGSKNISNSYQIMNSEDDGYKPTEELAKGLPEGFESDVWEYVETSETNKYSLPQIIGNTFVTTSTDWYIPPVQGPSFPVNAQSFSTSDGLYEGEIEEYAIVVTKFKVPEDVTYTYGMLLSEESGEFDEETADAIAAASKNFGGIYGILFHGNKFVNGNTYYVRPYVEINGEYTLGDITNFVFNAAE